MPTIQLRDVTKDNFYAVMALETSEEQKSFVAPNMFSIAEAHFYPQLIPQAIYDGETLVGFAMWGTELPDLAPGQYVIARLMIDKEHQGKGYGRAAMNELIGQLKAKPDCCTILLSYEPENLAADKLYTSLGFVATDGKWGNETIMKLEVANSD